MDSRNTYSFNREKRVIVTYKSSGDKRVLDCYDDGDGVTKEEDGFLWVKTKYYLTVTSAELSKAKWKRIAPLSKIEYVFAEKEADAQ